MPVIDDFFDGEKIPYIDKALVCSFCSTVGNIPAPLSQNPPRRELAYALSKMADAVQNGWLLVAFDTDQNEKHIKDYYAAFDTFQLNIFDRMAVELPMINFDPLAFEYEPVWIASSGQLAHMAVVQKDMTFSLGGQKLSVKEGQRLHIKNSFKFSPQLFETCCAAAHLEPIQTWSDTSTTKIYLLKKEAVEAQEAEPIALLA
jgi:uncharacterized SAM-dependent methyltransferase